MWEGFSIQGAAWLQVSAFLLVWLMLWVPFAVPLAWRLKWHPFQPVTIEQKLPLIIPLYLLAPLLVWGMAQLEGVSFAEYGLKFDSTLFLYLVLGVGLGIGGLAVVFLGEWVLGWVQWHPENGQKLATVALPLLGLGLWVGVTEELIFRGLFINELGRDYPLWVAAVLSSGIFALLHLIWERKDTIPQLPGLWLMGMVLVGARLVAGGSLGLAWGLHAGWVWGLASLDAAGFMSYTGKGALWLTGLGGQPLAGVSGILCLLMTGLVLWGL